MPVVSDFGPGDGLTRYVLTADEGVAPADLVQAVSLADGVVNAQPVGADRAPVATQGLAPHHLEALPGVADAEYSPAVPVAADTVADPYWPQYGWNLENTGTNAYNQAGRADADDDVTTGWEVGTGAGGGSSADVRTGPRGLRLVRSAVFSGLRTVWSTDCSASCRGVRV